MNDIMEVSFIERMNALKADALKTKSNPKYIPSWKPIHDELVQQICQYIQMAYTIGEEVAEEHYKENCVLHSYPTWMDYFSSQDMEVMRFNNKTSSRTKTKRLSSKITTCKLCGGKTHISGKTVVCDECGEVEPIVSKAGKSKSNNLKHTKNKIDCLIGSLPPPNKIQELEKYAGEWMLHMKWLYDWLDFKEKTFKLLKSRFTKAKWLADLQRIYIQNPRDETGTWKMDIEPIEKYKWTYPEYKLIITEFHAMLCECDRFATTEFTMTNMLSKSKEEKIEILKAYYDENKHIPKPKETFIYNGFTYDVGNFINLIKITHEESDFKDEVDQIFGENIRLPGLMFNFLSLSSRKAIDRFTLTESYSYLIHHTFKFPFIKIPPDDVEKILDLIQRFDTWSNEYTAKFKPKSTGLTKSNSKLYTCKLQCILTMPYFFKYIDLAQFLPVKGADTTASIQTDWRIFITSHENKDFIEQYMKTDEENENEKRNGERQVFDGLI